MKIINLTLHQDKTITIVVDDGRVGERVKTASMAINSL
jgi:hypothetical protein